MFPSLCRYAKKGRDVANIYKPTQTGLLHAVTPKTKTITAEQKRNKWSKTIRWKAMPSVMKHPLPSKLMTVIPGSTKEWNYQGIELSPDHPRYPLSPVNPDRFSFLRRKLKYMPTSTKALRTIDKHGGVDNYLLKTADRELGALGVELRSRVREAVQFVHNKLDSSKLSAEKRQKYIDALPTTDFRRDNRIWTNPIKAELRASQAEATMKGQEIARQKLKDSLADFKEKFGHRELPSKIESAIKSLGL